jgi:hypothetical protein
LVLLLAGAAITSASVGSLSHEPAFGFLVFGVMLLLAAILAAVEESE